LLAAAATRRDDPFAAVPGEWQTQQPLDDKVSVAVALPTTSDEYMRAAQRFMDGGFQCKIVLIQRVENHELWHRYGQAKAHMAKFRGEDKLNELWMLHGSRSTPPSVIMETGFDFRHSGHGYFGRGAYFAEHMSYSHGYRHTLANGKFQAFIGLVLAGVEENRGMNRDSNIVKPKDGCDSVRGLVTGTEEAVITYERGNAYPLYLVTYTVS
jgi:hypothetical protein